MPSNISVLLLDDEYSKTQDIIEVLKSVDVNSDNVKQVSTANDARKEMRIKKYDLLILDVNVPPSIGAPPSSRGGIELLEIMTLDMQVKMPSQIIGITEKDELYIAARNDFSSHAWTLCKYEKGAAEWKEILAKKVAHTIRVQDQGGASAQLYDVVIVTALRNPEFEAVLALPYQWKEITFPGDFLSYHVGVIPTATRDLSVIAASSLRMGMPSASALSMKMSMLFRPKLVVMLGICAGKADVCSLGDVIVADPVWDWGSGKYKDVAGVKSFAIAPHQVTIEPRFRSKIINMKDKASVLMELRGGWSEKVPAGSLKVHIGPMASGASVISDTDIMSDIEQQNRDTIAVEMEAYGVMAASEYASDPAPKALVIKSVCDFGDSAKHKEWQAYAAYTSAKFFSIAIRSLLEN